MLYVVAWPLLAEADDTALRRLRAQYHPREAETIGPHFTLVFGAAVSEEARLRGALEGITARPFWFMLDRLVRHDMTPPSRAAYLFAVPADGEAELTQLHETDGGLWARGPRLDLDALIPRRPPVPLPTTRWQRVRSVPW